MLIMSLVGGIFIPTAYSSHLQKNSSIMIATASILYTPFSWTLTVYHCEEWQAEAVIWNEYSVCVIGNQVLNSSGSPRWLLAGPPQQLFGNIVWDHLLANVFFPNELGWNWTHRCDSMCETHVTLTDDLADLENYSCLVPFENKVTQVIY